jgi:PDZ domain-containing secreted protein
MVFGIDVLVSTQFTAGVAVLFDTRIYGGPSSASP